MLLFFVFVEVEKQVVSAIGRFEIASTVVSGSGVAVVDLLEAGVVC